jgi:predicted enzyme related to lactoylglutathione lyase
MSSAGIRGVFVWNELMTTDPEAAAAFYRAVVGWETRPWGHQVAYTLCVAPTGPVAGIMALPEDARAAGALPSWLGYVGTPDLDASVVHATGLGARVLKGATTIEGSGRFAVLADPQGASFGIYTPSQSAPQPPMAAGQFVWHELTSDDVEASLGFYRALFGWEEMRRMDMGAAGPYVIFGSDGVQRGGMYRRPPGQAGGAGWLAYAHVASAESATAAATAAGARVLHGPADVPGGRITMLVDPQGAPFAVHSAAMAAAAPAAAARKAPAKARATPKAKAKAKAKVKPAAKPRPAPKRKVAAKRKAVPKRKVAAKRKSAPKRKVAKRPARRRAVARRHR